MGSTPFPNCHLAVSQKDWGFIWRFNELLSAGGVWSLIWSFHDLLSTGCAVRSDGELSTDHQKCPFSTRKKGLLQDFVTWCGVSEAKHKKSVFITLSILTNKLTDP